MSNDDPVELAVAFLRFTRDAVLVEYDEHEIWLPRSQVEYDGDLEACQKSELIDITLPEWLAYEKGLI